MLESHLSQLAQDLKIPLPESTQGEFTLSLSPDISLQFQERHPGFRLRAHVSSVPPTQKEFLFSYLLKANFLGQGTGGRVLGIDPTEQLISLSHELSKELPYEAFKQSVEEFVNYLCYWQTEVKRLQKTSSPSNL